MKGLDLGKAAVAGEAAEDADPQLIEQRLDLPELAGDIEFANQADIVALGRGKGRVVRPWGGFALANHLPEHYVARYPVAKIFAAVEAGGVNGDDRDAGGGLRGRHTASMSSPSIAGTQVL